MANLSDVYNFRKVELPVGDKFMFTSIGNKTIIKAVQYTYTNKFEDRNVYNLGFGDYDLELNEIIDETYSNNGDAYKIFRTVLSTIPVFFEHYPTAVITVQGSDSRADFAERCKVACIKQCQDICRKLNQRISVYRNFIEKNFFELSRTYWFLGGFVKDGKIIAIELYRPGRAYGAILFFQK